MRYYEVYLPGEAEPIITTGVRQARNIPEGTRITAIVTERGEMGIAAAADEIVSRFSATEYVYVLIESKTIIAVVRLRSVAEGWVEKKEGRRFEMFLLQ